MTRAWVPRILDAEGKRTLHNQVRPEDTHGRNTDARLGGTVGSAEAGEDDGGHAPHRAEEGLTYHVSIVSGSLVMPFLAQSLCSSRRGCPFAAAGRCFGVAWQEVVSKGVLGGTYGIHRAIKVGCVSMVSRRRCSIPTARHHLPYALRAIAHGAPPPGSLE